MDTASVQFATLYKLRNIYMWYDCSVESIIAVPSTEPQEEFQSGTAPKIDPLPLGQSLSILHDDFRTS